MNKQTYPILDAAAVVIASAHYQLKVVRAVNPAFTEVSRHPSSTLYVELPETADGVMPEAKSVPAVSHYAKLTLNSDNMKWLHDDTVTVKVTDADRKEAQEYIDIISNSVLLKVLRGEAINDFIKSMVKLIEAPEIKMRDIGLLSYLFMLGRQFKCTADLDAKKASYYDSKPIGSDGTRIKAEVTIFNKRLMKQYDSILYEGNDAVGNLVTFYKQMNAKVQYDVDSTYKLDARIKSTGATNYSNGAIVNTLNYVKTAKA